jgi:hypothetical protein
MPLPWEDEEHEERYRGRFFGKYRAFVRDNHDPERLGRCRLEVPAVLGVGPENWSDWASPCFPFGGVDNCGTFLVPPEGASVWAEFEGGDPQYPIWSGVWLAGTNPGEMPEEAKRLCAGSECSSCLDAAEHAKNLQDNLEHRKFHAHPPYWCPKVYVLAKTPAGHVVLLDDRESDACIRIADSSGQEITLTSGRKVEITDRAGSRITMDAESGDITIASAGMVHINP